MAIKSLCGPLSSWVIKRFSCRTAHITGAVLLIIGLGCCDFATQIWQIYIVYGIIAGVGYSLCCLAITATVPHYFDKYKNIAFPIVVLGSIVGTTIWPPITQAMFTELGYSTTMGILGLLQFVQIINGSFFNERDLTVTDEDEKGKNEALQNSSAISSSESVSGNKDRTRNGHSQSSPGTDETTALIAKHNEYEKQIDTSNTKTSMTRQMSFWSSVKSLYSDWKVWCLSGSFGLFIVPFLGFKQFAIDYVVKYCGLTEAEGALGISIGAIGSLLTTFLMIGLNKVRFDRLYVFCWAPAAFGCCNLLIAFTNGKAMYYIVAFVWGLTRGFLGSSAYTVCHELREPELFHIIFGFNLMLQGVFTAITGPVFSYLQSNGSHIGGMCFGSAAGVLGTLVIMPVVVHRIKSTPRSLK